MPIQVAVRKHPIPGLSADGQHLYLVDKAILPEGNLDMVTHMIVDKHKPPISLPKNLEYLFIVYKKKGVWPTVKNLFIEECDTKAYLEHNAPEVFSVFAINREYIDSRFTIKCYTLGPNKSIDAFGVTWPYREAVRNRPETFFPDEEIVIMPEQGLTPLKGLSPRTKQLHLANVNPLFQPPDLLNVTHLLLRQVTDKTIIPESMEYLFVTDHKERDKVPVVKNLFIEGNDVEAFLSYNSHNVFHIYDWCRKDVFVRKLKNYDIGPKKTIRAFGYDYVYCTATRIREPPSFPDEKIVTVWGNCNKKRRITLRGLSARTTHLNLELVNPWFKACELLNVTHLMLYRVTKNTEIPTSLEYLFIYNQQEGTWPVVKHLFIEKQDVMAYLEHNSPTVFYAYYRFGMNQRMECPDGYVLEPESTIEAFGCTYTYHRVTKIEHMTIA